MLKKYIFKHFVIVIFYYISLLINFQITCNRLLEEGNLNRAEAMKLSLEQTQRERRKQKEETGEQHEPKWFRKTVRNGIETWEYNHMYWDIRKNPGFTNYSLEKLW